MLKAQPLGVRRQQKRKNGMRRGRSGLVGERHPSLPQEQRRGRRLGRVAFVRGAERRCAKQVSVIFESRLDTGYRNVVGQKRERGIRHNRLYSYKKRIGRNIQNFFQKLRSGQREISGYFARFRMVRRGASTRYISGMPYESSRQKGRDLGHDDPS